MSLLCLDASAVEFRPQLAGDRLEVHEVAESGPKREVR